MARTLGFCIFETPIGPCGIAWADVVLTGVQLPTEAKTRERMQRRFSGIPETAPSSLAIDAIDRIRSLLQGAKDDLADLPLDMDGIPQFHRGVYEITRAIPCGRTRTYGEIATELGQPGAARAVGQALGHNPFAPVVPCHRVLAAGNSGGGFSAEGGVGTKLRMLQIEGAQLGAEPGLF